MNKKPTDEIILSETGQKAFFKVARKIEASKRSVPDTSPMPSFYPEREASPYYSPAHVYMWLVVVFSLLFYLISLFVN